MGKGPTIDHLLQETPMQAKLLNFALTAAACAVGVWGYSKFLAPKAK